MGKRKKRRQRQAAEADSRAALAARRYEAALHTPARPLPAGGGESQDSANEGAMDRLRHWGRYLDDNHDIASAALDEFVKNVVGSGIVTIPKPLNPDGSVNESLGVELMRQWRRWTRRADVTNELTWGGAQRIICRAWARDGEHFVRHVEGRQAPYPFAADEAPYRLELLEADFVPLELTRDGWRQGIRFNEWRAPLEYAAYRQHPGDWTGGLSFGATTPDLDSLKRLPASSVTHIKNTKRWPAARGVSTFATVISRLFDVKDLEESERLKNRQLASWVAAVQRSPDIPGYDPQDDQGRRFHEVFGGMLIDTLAPGETINGVGPDYPTANMPEHIADQVRRVAAGMGVRYSSLSKHYEGSYSAMRQEMVESIGHYEMREDAFVQTVVRSVYERWLLQSMLDGRVSIPPTADLDLVANAEYRGPVTPWIDPLKEVQADKLAVEAGFADIDQIRIKRGAPAEMIGAPAPQAREPAQLELIESEDEAA